MALDAGVACLHVIHAGGIQSIPSGWMIHMLASRSVATFAPYIPLDHLFCVDIVIHRMAAVACGAVGRCILSAG